MVWTEILLLISFKESKFTADSCRHLFLLLFLQTFWFLTPVSPSRSERLPQTTARACPSARHTITGTAWMWHYSNTLKAPRRLMEMVHRTICRCSAVFSDPSVRHVELWYTGQVVMQQKEQNYVLYLGLKSKQQAWNPRPSTDQRPRWS